MRQNFEKRYRYFKVSFMHQDTSPSNSECVSSSGSGNDEESGFHYNVLYILDGLENMAALMEATINFYESHRSSSRQARTEQISCQV